MYSHRTDKRVARRNRKFQGDFCCWYSWEFTDQFQHLYLYLFFTQNRLSRQTLSRKLVWFKSRNISRLCECFAISLSLSCFLKLILNANGDLKRSSNLFDFIAKKRLQAYTYERNAFHLKNSHPSALSSAFEELRNLAVVQHPFKFINSNVFHSGFAHSSEISDMVENCKFSKWKAFLLKVTQVVGYLVSFRENKMEGNWSEE